MFSKMRGELDRNVALSKGETECRFIKRRNPDIALSKGETRHRFIKRRKRISLYKKAKTDVALLTGVTKSRFIKGGPSDYVAL